VSYHFLVNLSFILCTVFGTEQCWADDITTREEDVGKGNDCVHSGQHLEHMCHQVTQWEAGRREEKVTGNRNFHCLIWTLWPGLRTKNLEALEFISLEGPRGLRKYKTWPFQFLCINQSALYQNEREKDLDFI
jgi:hypothetical protein